jgi:hypothetical protein
MNPNPDDLSARSQRHTEPVRRVKLPRTAFKGLHGAGSKAWQPSARGVLKLRLARPARRAGSLDLPGRASLLPRRLAGPGERDGGAARAGVRAKPSRGTPASLAAR